jgi:DNA-binding HxlR family transcriptional regulator
LALPAVSREVLSEHLSRLTREGWINDDAKVGQAAGAHGAHREPMPQLPASAGGRAFGMLADEMTRRTLLRLGRAPCDARQLQRDLQVNEPALRRTLTRLLHQRFIAQPHVRASSLKLDAPFELEAAGRGLAVIAFMLAHIEWASLQADGPPPEHSLIEYLRLLAPAATAPRGLSGQCRLVERYPAGPSQTVSLRVEHATITVQAGAGTARPDVRVSGLLPAWNDALLSANTDHLLISGDLALFHVVLGALHDATSS